MSSVWLAWEYSLFLNLLINLLIKIKKNTRRNSPQSKHNHYVGERCNPINHPSHRRLAPPHQNAVQRRPLLAPIVWDYILRAINRRRLLNIAALLPGQQVFVFPMKWGGTNPSQDTREVVTHLQMKQLYLWLTAAQGPCVQKLLRVSGPKRSSGAQRPQISVGGGGV